MIDERRLLKRAIELVLQDWPEDHPEVSGFLAETRALLARQEEAFEIRFTEHDIWRAEHAKGLGHESIMVAVPVDAILRGLPGRSPQDHAY